MLPALKCFRCFCDIQEIGKEIFFVLSSGFKNRGEGEIRFENLKIFLRLSVD